METESLGMRMFGIGRAIQAFDGPDSDGPGFDGSPLHSVLCCLVHMEWTLRKAGQSMVLISC